MWQLSSPNEHDMQKSRYRLHSLWQYFKSAWLPNNKTTMQMPNRVPVLDNLRIVLFGLLILHHIGMFYSLNWGWHAKSIYRSEWLESLLLIVEPWRMPAIWLISGIAIRFILAKLSLIKFVILRSYRLLLPLLFGVLIVVPPQLYVEMTANGDISMSFWQFMHAFYQPNHPLFEDYQAGIWPHIDVNHLWYLRSLWYYSLYLVILLPQLNSRITSNIRDWFSKQPGILFIATLIAAVLAIQLIWQDGETRYPIGFMFLVLGYLIGWHTVFWEKLGQHLKSLGLCYLLISALVILGYNAYWLHDTKTPVLDIIMLTIYSSARVIGLLLILSIACNYFSKSAPVWRYLTPAVYPFYILHQTIILSAGWWLTQQGLPAVIEIPLLVGVTFIGCWLGFEFIRRIDLLRPLFGMKVKQQYSSFTLRLGYMTAALAVSPLAAKLII